MPVEVSVAITEKQLEQRAKGFGASEIAALLGEDPYRTAGDVIMSKLGVRVEESEENELAELGTLMEGPLSTLAAKRLGVKLVKPTSTYWGPNEILFANPDRQIEKPSRGAPPVEFKDTGIMDGWGESGSDEVPSRVLLQVQAQMICLETDVAHVAAMLYPFGRRELRMYRIGRNEQICKIILEETAEFWNKYVLRREPLPASLAPGREVANRLPRTTGKVISIPDSLVRVWREADAKLKEAEGIAEEAKNAVRSFIAQQGAEAAACDLGLVTDKSQSRAGIDAELLKSKFPDAYAAVQKSTSFRVMRFSAAKKVGVN